MKSYAKKRKVVYQEQQQKQQQAEQKKEFKVSYGEEQQQQQPPSVYPQLEHCLFAETMLENALGSLPSDRSSGEEDDVGPGSYTLRQNPKKSTKVVAPSKPQGGGKAAAKKKKEHVCQECGRGFATIKGLSGHMRCHPARTNRAAAASAAAATVAPVSVPGTAIREENYDSDVSLEKVYLRHWAKQEQEEKEKVANKDREEASKAREKIDAPVGNKRKEQTRECEENGSKKKKKSVKTVIDQEKPPASKVGDETLHWQPLKIRFKCSSHALDAINNGCDNGGGGGVDPAEVPASVQERVECSRCGLVFDSSGDLSAHHCARKTARKSKIILSSQIAASGAKARTVNGGVETIDLEKEEEDRR